MLAEKTQEVGFILRLSEFGKNKGSAKQQVLKIEEKKEDASKAESRVRSLTQISWRQQPSAMLAYKYIVHAQQKGIMGGIF